MKSTPIAKIRNACYRCGSPKHKANFKSCPALGQTCRKCSERDHYAKVCLADGQPKVHQLEEAESESEDYVLTIDPSDKHDRPCRRCIVKIEGTMINVLVDSGSPYTIIPKELYDSLFSKANCMKAIFLQAVSEVRISLYKAFSKLRYKTRIVPIRTKYTSPRKALQFLGGLHILNFR